MVLGLVIQQGDTVAGVDRRLADQFASARFSRGSAHKINQIIARINELCAQAADELTAPAAAKAGDPIAQAHAPNSQVVAPANLNSPDQTVISGSSAGVHRAIDLCNAAGAKKTGPDPALLHPATLKAQAPWWVA